MKKVILTLSSILVAIGAYAQGTVNFSARVVGTYDAPVFVGALTGARPDGAAYLAQLYAGPSDATLAAVGEAVPFRTGAAAGYWTAASRTIGTVVPGADAAIQIKAWAVASGANYEAALAAGGQAGNSAILRIRTGGDGRPPSLPANLAGLASFAIGFPEPSITMQPVSQTVLEGDGAVFSVRVGGIEPFSYQWRKNGVEIPGATNNVLFLSDVQTSAQGMYSVAISNDFGGTISQGALLSVIRLDPLDYWTVRHAGSSGLPGDYQNLKAVAYGNGQFVATFVLQVAGVAPHPHEFYPMLLVHFQKA